MQQLATIYGPQAVFGDVALRPVTPEDLAEIGRDVDVYETHSHLGGGVRPAYLYDLGLKNGIAGLEMGKKKFTQLGTLYPGRARDLENYLDQFYDTSERIQAGPQNVSDAMIATIEWAFNRAGETFLGSDQGGQASVFEDLAGMEVRFNVDKRSGNNYDNNAVMDAAYGALIPYNRERLQRAGIIVCLAKDLNIEKGLTPEARHAKNLQQAENANRWAREGKVIGIDTAGSEHYMTLSSMQDISHIQAWYDTACFGLDHLGIPFGKTFHIAETDHTASIDVIRLIENVELNRLGHGVILGKRALYGDHDSVTALEALKTHNITLELCMYSNLCSGAIKNVHEFCLIIEYLDKHQIPFVLGTDGMCIHGFDPETTSRRNGSFGVTITDEIAMMRMAGASKEVLRTALQRSKEVTFLKQSISS